MSAVLDETAADVPVRDPNPVCMSRSAAGPQDLSVIQNARTQQDISRVSREDLEDRFLRLHEETLLLKQHIHKQNDKIKKLGTKLMRLVKDRGRMERLAVGEAQPFCRVRDVEMEEMMEELQEKVRGLQFENEGLKQRLLLAKQQLMNSQSRRPSLYGHVQSRVNSGLKRQTDDSPPRSQIRPRSRRCLEGGGRPPTGQLPQYGHSLLEEARAEISNLENVVESQRSHMEEMEVASEQLREVMRKKEVEYEEKLLQLRQLQTNKLRSHVNNNVTMIKLQQQLSDRTNAVTELEVRFLQLQKSQLTLKTSHDAAMEKVDELTAQLKDERLKSLDLEAQLQSCNLSRRRTEQLQEQLSELEQERDLLKENNQRLLDQALDVSQQQRWRIQEQQLKLQISQLEMALKVDLQDKNEVINKFKAEREVNERLTDENKRLQIQFLEQKQGLEELRNHLQLYNRGNEYDVAELTEALMLMKMHKSQQKGDLGFLEMEEGGGSESSIRELRAAHAETIQELEKTRNLLNIESRISRDYKVELEAVHEKMDRDRLEYKQRLDRQAQLLDTRMEKIRGLEAQIREVAYGTKTYVFKPDVTDEEEEDAIDETLQLERGENLLELQIVGATLSPSTLDALGDAEPSTFCTYSFYLFELHSTPVVMSHRPRYGFTSKYLVSMDNHFLDFLSRASVAVELHQALGLDWRTLGTAHLSLRQLLEHDGKVHGAAQLVGVSEGAWSVSSEGMWSVGSVEYWLRLRIPMTETICLYQERMKAVSSVSAAVEVDSQVPAGVSALLSGICLNFSSVCNEPIVFQPPSSSWNQLLITVLCCRDLQSRTSCCPSAYVVYRFFDFSDCPTATVYDSCDPQFNELRSYSVLMDESLDQYLKSEVLQFYVFDDREEQMDTYLGKTRVPLLSLAQDKGFTGVFELSNPSGLAAGHIEVTLTWKFTYYPELPEEPAGLKKEGPLKVRAPEEIHHLEEKEEEEDNTKGSLHLSQVHPEAPKLKQTTLLRGGLATKKVTFVDPSDQVEDWRTDQTETSPPAVKVSPQEEEDDDDDEEDESHVSEGQLVPASSQSLSEDSDISEDMVQNVEDAPDTKQDQSESTQSDSDDCIIQTQVRRKPSERVRVEIVSLSLRPESRVAQDASVVRLFVEYSFLDLPTEETPLSLPKPPQGKTINYNYSKVIPLDAEDNVVRRRLLRSVLQRRNPPMERIRFTVVSEPPEEEEQDQECEDVGVASIRITDILDTRQDLTETRLDVMCVKDSSKVVGSLVVSVEALEALLSIMEDPDQHPQQTPSGFHQHEHSPRLTSSDDITS
ncbi:protein fantom isoform X3 [Echeneis naucrates]|uniref:protein fantom isoform X3 n=1 Tax=Echeneis naucrates TaxID=173247 RepID=UPI001113BC85|nr:protein fantom isoform X3 [Echeneis naucrates]